MKFTVSVPEEVLEEMDERAGTAEVSRSEYVRRAILAYGSWAEQPPTRVASDERDQFANLVAERDREIAALRTDSQRESAGAERARGTITATLSDSGRQDAEVDRLRSELKGAKK